MECFTENLDNEVGLSSIESVTTELSHCILNPNNLDNNKCTVTPGINLYIYVPRILLCF
jgi:hypothetical protein